ncbi:MAG: Anthranilate phosphoribosyltransferase [Brockia lithotrophica]|uniref:Anthranilate phosphoribosyltransferase n=1 Tax=Brockia lithotrophica TaxID=933949 RepID=A0A2T5G744_9BACL|nr:MAG: Anthranilate phosphoribosyltransferase [Brockia lithotrophica]
MRAYLERLVRRNSLTREEARAALTAVVEGEATPVQAAALLTALRAKGEDVEEVLGFVETLRAYARPFPSFPGAVDTAGTGGDGGITYNVSTAAALVAASAGVPVIKHGNRAASGRSGSADALEGLGFPVQLSAEGQRRLAEELGFAFLFAPLYHPAMARLRDVRRELGIPTVMNFLGPLTNPAGVRRQVLGVSAPERLEFIAEVLRRLGVEHALVVSGACGGEVGRALDEVSVFGPTRVAEIRGDRTETYVLDPADLGLPRFACEEVTRVEAETAGAFLRALLGAGAEENGARHASGRRAAGRGAPTEADRALLYANAGAVLYVAGFVPSLAEGVRRAREVVEGETTSAYLERLLRRAAELRRREGDVPDAAPTAG